MLHPVFDFVCRHLRALWSHGRTSWSLISLPCDITSIRSSPWIWLQRRRLPWCRCVPELQRSSLQGKHVISLWLRDNFFSFEVWNNSLTNTPSYLLPSLFYLLFSFYIFFHIVTILSIITLILFMLFNVSLILYFYLKYFYTLQFLLQS